MIKLTELSEEDNPETARFNSEEDVKKLSLSEFGKKYNNIKLGALENTFRRYDRATANELQHKLYLNRENLDK